MEKRKNRLLYLFIFSLLISACVPSGQLHLPDSALTFTIVPPTKTITTTPTITATAEPKYSATPLPSPTFTPRVHTIKKGDTMGGLAWFYNVPIDLLRTMNPDINPNVMIVGTQVLIPAQTSVPANLTPQPTPINLPLEGLNCLHDVVQGVWCFVWVSNPTDESLENVVISVNIADQSLNQTFSRQGNGALNVLPAGQKIPAAVYFPPTISAQIQKSASLVSAIPYNQVNERYQLLKIEMLQEEYELNDQFVRIKGNYAASAPVNTIEIVAVGLDENGNIIALKNMREILSSPSMTGVFMIDLASVAGRIHQVLLLGEGQP